MGLIWRISEGQRMGKDLKQNYMNTTNIKVSLLQTNKGQIEGLPKNPRLIKDKRYEKLKKSIQDAPEMLQMRSLIVVQHGKQYVVICGNMRLKACKDLGYNELPCYVLPGNTPVEKLREYTIKDNVAFGETDWDILASEWDDIELADWGFDVWVSDEETNKELSPSSFMDVAERQPQEPEPQICPYCGRDISKYGKEEETDDDEERTSLSI